VLLDDDMVGWRAWERSDLQEIPELVKDYEWKHRGPSPWLFYFTKTIEFMQQRKIYL